MRPQRGHESTRGGTALHCTALYSQDLLAKGSGAPLKGTFDATDASDDSGKPTPIAVQSAS